MITQALAMMVGIFLGFFTTYLTMRHHYDKKRAELKGPGRHRQVIRYGPSAAGFWDDA